MFEPSIWQRLRFVDIKVCLPVYLYICHGFLKILFVASFSFILFIYFLLVSWFGMSSIRRPVCRHDTSGGLHHRQLAAVERRCLTFLWRQSGYFCACALQHQSSFVGRLGELHSAAASCVSRITNSYVFSVLGIVIIFSLKHCFVRPDRLH